MAGNSFGELFRITTCGESHGGAIAVIVDGCPPGLLLAVEDVQKDLDLRRPGQSNLTTSRAEKDQCQILSGVFEGRTTGTPILIIVFNKDAKSSDYDSLKDIFRPSHADYTYFAKYGIRDYRGGGRASARETTMRVAAGAIAKKYLSDILGIEIVSYVEQVGAFSAQIDMNSVTKELVESNMVRCPDQCAAIKMAEYIEAIKGQGDSIGGVIRCLIRNVPSGLGDPVFDKLHADLGKAMLSINAVKGFEVGSGFSGVGLPGSIHNDEITINENGGVHTKTNNAGGIVGGISNGEDIYFRVAFKSVSTISSLQSTVSMSGDIVDFKGVGRHDPCVLPRAVPIVDAMSALVIMDHYLRNKAYKN
jgi:chorismate synthase